MASDWATRLAHKIIDRAPSVSSWYVVGSLVDARRVAAEAIDAAREQGIVDAAECALSYGEPWMAEQIRALAHPDSAEGGAEDE